MNGDAEWRSKTPMEAANRGGDRSRPMREDWNEVKDRAMYDALMAQVTRHENLNKLLLETGDSILVEHTVNDNYWGDGGDGTGENMLGKLLMVVRDDLR